MSWFDNLFKPREKERVSPVPLPHLPPYYAFDTLEEEWDYYYRFLLHEDAAFYILARIRQVEAAVRGK